MASPGTGSTNQSLTFAASKRVYGKAHTSNKREIYDYSHCDLISIYPL